MPEGNRIGHLLNHELQNATGEAEIGDLEPK
jgi:hypothetical protein